MSPTDCFVPYLPGTAIRSISTTHHTAGALGNSQLHTLGQSRIRARREIRSAHTLGQYWAQRRGIEPAPPLARKAPAKTANLAPRREAASLSTGQRSRYPIGGVGLGPGLAHGCSSRRWRPITAKRVAGARWGSEGFWIRRPTLWSWFALRRAPVPAAIVAQYRTLRNFRVLRQYRT
eukprot:583357-Rhodomonas_salina.2